MFLTYNTISDILSIGLFDEKKESIFSFFQEKVSKEQATLLIPKIQDLLKEAQLSFNHLSGVAFCCGPGSFTGARMGCAAALGFSAAISLPLFGITSFQMHGALLSKRMCQTQNPMLIFLKSGHQDICVQALDRNLLPFPGLFEHPKCFEKKVLLDLLKVNSVSYNVGGDNVLNDEESHFQNLTFYKIFDEETIWAEWIGKAAFCLQKQGIYPPAVPLYVRPAYVNIPE